MTTALATWLSQEHRSAVSDVFVLSDSLSVLSADTTGVMKLWDAEHGTTRLSINGPVGHLCLAPSSQLAVSGDLHDTRLVPCTSYLFNPLIATLKPQSNGPSYSNTVIGTLAVDGWAVTFDTAMRGLGGAAQPAQASHRCTKCNSPPING